MNIQPMHSSAYTHSLKENEIRKIFNKVDSEHKYSPATPCPSVSDYCKGLFEYRQKK